MLVGGLLIESVETRYAAYLEANDSCVMYE
jgi:hypothetical protein